MDAITNEATVTVTLNQPTYSNKTLSVSGNASAVVDVDLTKGEYYDYYIKAIAVAVKKGDIDAAKALYAQGSDAVKDEFDKGTVKAVLEQLEDVTYAQVAELAAKANNETVDEYMAKYADEVKAAVAKVNEYATKALNRFEGNALLSKTIGSLDSDDDGVYEWSGDVNNRTADKTFKGYTVALTVEKVAVDATVNIFGSCNRKDPNHDGFIDIRDVVYLRKMLITEFDGLICEYCADVDDNDVIDIRDVVAMRKILIMS